MEYHTGVKKNEYSLKKKKHNNKKDEFHRCNLD